MKPCSKIIGPQDHRHRVAGHDGKAGDFAVAPYPGRGKDGAGAILHPAALGMRGGHWDKAAELRVAKGADPERAVQIADVGDNMFAARRRGDAPEPRDDDPPSLFVADDNGRIAARRNETARPDVSGRIGPQRMPNLRRMRVKAISRWQGVSLA